MKKTAGEAKSVSVQNYRELLMKKKAELRRALQSTSQQLAEKEEQSGADAEQLLQKQWVSLRLNQVLYEQLLEVEGALGRLERGNYGDCLTCGNAIAHKRLEAVPWTRYCLLCQESAGSLRHPVETGIERNVGA
jgi:RNA polymerase-binding transcription factor